MNNINQNIISLLIGYGSIGLTFIFIFLVQYNEKLKTKTNVDRPLISIIIGRITFTLFNLFFRFDVYIKRFFNFIKNIIGSITGIIFSVYLYTETFQTTLSTFTDLKAIFFSIGGLIGTMLALILTLSIISIQRATEAFSPSVVQLYRSDNGSNFIYFLLALFCITSFVAGLNGIPLIDNKNLIPVSIFMLACSFDLIRWHYRHVSLLLTPRYAIKKLFDSGIKYTTKLQTRISIVAYVQYFIFHRKNVEELKREDLETSLYATNALYAEQINSYIKQITEIVHKSIRKGEVNTCEYGIESIVGIAQHYLTKRKDNIILLPSPETSIFALEPDARDILTPVYEHLQDINSSATRESNEYISLKVVEMFSIMAVFTANLKARTFREHSTPITFTPIYYMKECIKAGKENNLFEVVYQSSAKLSYIVKNAPKHADQSTFYGSIIEGYVDIIMYLYILKKGSLVNNVLSDLMSIPFYVVGQEHFQARDIIEDILEKIYRLLPITISSQNLQNINLPLITFSPYSTATLTSLGYLVEQSTVLIKDIDKERSWVNPYGDFMELNKSIYRHFIDIAENIQFGDNFILHEIIETIVHITKVYLMILEKPLNDNHVYEYELVEQIISYQVFFGIIFQNAETFDYRRAQHACDSIAWAGMSFYIKEHPLVIDHSIINISSIIKSSYKFEDSKKHFRIADLMRYLWMIRIFLVKHKNDVLIKKIDETITTQPDNFTDENWITIQNNLENRKGHIERELKKFTPYGIMRDSAGRRSISLLKFVLK